MPVLPLIDLLILVAWTLLGWAVFHKALWMALASRFTVFGLGPFDFFLAAGVCLLFAIALAARVWVKANEPRLLRERSQAAHPEPLHEYHRPEPEAAPEPAAGVAAPDAAVR